MTRVDNGATFVDNGIPMLDTRLDETLGATFVDNGIPMFGTMFGIMFVCTLVAMLGTRFDDVFVAMLGIRFVCTLGAMLGTRFVIMFVCTLGIRFDDVFGIRFDDAFSPAFDRAVWLCFGGIFCSRLCLSTNLFIKSIVSLNSVSNFSTGDIIIGSPLLSELNILSYCSA